MTLVIVNCTGDTLTEVASGGIAAWVLGVSEASLAAGDRPVVITRRHPQHPTAWAGAVELNYPRPPFVRGVGHLDDLRRRRSQYPHRQQAHWNRMILNSVRRAGPVSGHVLCNNDPELAVYLAERLPRYEVTHLLHNENDMGPRWLPRYRERVRTLAVSEHIAGWAQTTFALPSRPQVLYNGVDCTAFSPGPKDGALPRVTYVGLLNERKAPDLLLQAAIALAEQGLRTFVIDIIGAVHYGGDDTTEYTEYLSRLQGELQSYGVLVTFHGFLGRQDLARVLSRSDIHVVPSRWEEPFSLAALEGMASGAATVVTRRGGLPEVVGEAGLVVEPDDPRALAEALHPLVSSAVLRDELGRLARSRAELFSWSVTWARLKDILNPTSSGSAAVRHSRGG